MKLTTYNFLTSSAKKGVKVGFPLKLTVHKKHNVEVEFNSGFLQRLIPKLDWSAVRLAAQAVEMADEIPLEPPTNLTENDELLEKMHHLLMEIDIDEGELECPESGRIFPIKNGIPNMLLNEDEV